MRFEFGGRQVSAVAVMLVSLARPSASVGAMQTTTTTYRYNADHALTAVTTAGDGQSSTLYFTWDNCLVGTSSPTSCTVSAGNGNLVGFGPTPGSSYTTQFAFDQRNRLTGASASGAQAVSYTYHPASLMATATLASNDALAFTYDASSLPRMTNIRQASTSTWAGYLGDTTYLSDGSEQVRCVPRKDVAGVYEPDAGSFTPVRYDPYGTIESPSGDPSSPATGGAAYDMTQNPFRYTDEYADPSWGGTYLRARWYLRQYETFIGRDRADAVHRYGYAGGDPVGNVDPSGLSFDKFLRSLTTGKMAWVTPLVPVWGQFVGGASLLAHLPELWHHPRSMNTWASYGFLVLSSALEGAGEFPWLDRAMGSAAAFKLRGAEDIFAGMSQALLGNFNKRKGKWDVPGLIQSVEYTVGGMFWSRFVAGIGYRPYYLSSEDVDRGVNAYFGSGDHDDRALVFRVRYKQFPITRTSPLLEWRGLGPYHEALLVVGERDLTLAHLTNPDGMQYSSELILGARNQDVSTFIRPQNGPEPELDFIGKYRESYVDKVIETEHANGRINENVSDSRGSLRSRRPDYRAGIRNNCHDYVARILRAGGLR